MAECCYYTEKKNPQAAQKASAVAPSALVLICTLADYSQAHLLQLLVFVLQLSHPNTVSDGSCNKNKTL